VSAWGSGDPTEPQPRPVAQHQPIRNDRRNDRRNDSIMIALVVLLTFTLGAIVMMGTIYSLYGTVEQLMQTPMCREVK
jgi:hypothetical protein